MAITAPKTADEDATNPAFVRSLVTRAVEILRTTQQDEDARSEEQQHVLQRLTHYCRFFAIKSSEPQTALFYRLIVESGGIRHLTRDQIRELLRFRWFVTLGDDKTLGAYSEFVLQLLGLDPHGYAEAVLPDLVEQLNYSKQTDKEGQKIRIQDREFENAKGLKQECREILKLYQNGEYLEEDDFLFMKDVFRNHPCFLTHGVAGGKAANEFSSSQADAIKSSARSTSGEVQLLSIDLYTKVGCGMHSLYPNQRCFFLANDSGAEPYEISYARSVDNIHVPDNLVRDAVEKLIGRIIRDRAILDTTTYELLMKNFPHKWAAPAGHRLYTHSLMKLCIFVPALTLRLLKATLFQMVQIDIWIADQLLVDDGTAKNKNKQLQNNAITNSSALSEAASTDATTASQQNAGAAGSILGEQIPGKGEGEAVDEEDIDEMAQRLDVMMLVVLEFLRKYFDVSLEQFQQLGAQNNINLLLAPSPLGTNCLATPRASVGSIADGVPQAETNKPHLSTTDKRLLRRNSSDSAVPAMLGNKESNMSNRLQAPRVVPGRRRNSSCITLDDVLSQGKQTLLHFLMVVFQDLFISRRLQCKNVQFVYFFLCSLHPKFCEKFLVSSLKTFYNPQLPVPQRCASLNFLGSMLVRARYLTTSYALKTTRYLIEWCVEMLPKVEQIMRCEEFEKHQVHTLVDSIQPEVELFHLAVQTICYIMIFKAEDFIKTPLQARQERLANAKQGLSGGAAANSTSTKDNNTSGSGAAVFGGTGAGGSAALSRRNSIRSQNSLGGTDEADLNASFFDHLFFGSGSFPSCNFSKVLLSRAKPLRRIFPEVKDEFAAAIERVGYLDKIQHVLEWTFGDSGGISAAFDPWWGYSVSAIGFPFDPYQLRNSKALIAPIYINYDAPEEYFEEDEEEYAQDPHSDNIPSSPGRVMPSSDDGGGHLSPQHSRAISAAKRSANLVFEKVVCSSKETTMSMKKSSMKRDARHLVDPQETALASRERNKKRRLQEAGANQGSDDARKVAQLSSALEEEERSDSDDRFADDHDTLPGEKMAPSPGFGPQARGGQYVDDEDDDLGDFALEGMDDSDDDAQRDVLGAMLAEHDLE